MDLEKFISDKLRNEKTWEGLMRGSTNLMYLNCDSEPCDAEAVALVEGVRKDSEHSTEMYSKTYKTCFTKLHIPRKFQLRFLSYPRFQTCDTQQRTTGIRVF
ncbi:hypothetical protein C0J52_06783 [Blattella germanica]|nr:hypothetical protein C0J52_06783 [Blattella germanica]